MEASGRKVDQSLLSPLTPLLYTVRGALTVRYCDVTGPEV